MCVGVHLMTEPAIKVDTGQESSVRRSGRKVLHLKDGNIESMPVLNHSAACGISSPSLKVHEKLPHVTGNFVLITGNIESFVEIIEDKGAFFYRTFSGERGYELTSKQRLIGPINSHVQLEGLKVDLSSMSNSAVPTSDSGKEQLEIELDDAYEKIVQLERQIKSLENVNSNNPLKGELTKAQDAISKHEETITQLHSRANVAEEELDSQMQETREANRKVQELDKLVKELSKRAEETPALKEEIVKLRGLLSQVKEAETANVVSMQSGQNLSEEQESALLGIQMLLLSLKSQVDMPFTINRISELIEQLESD